MLLVIPIPLYSCTSPTRPSHPACVCATVSSIREILPSADQLADPTLNNAESPRPRVGGLVPRLHAPRRRGHSPTVSTDPAPAGVIDQARTGDRAPAHTRGGRRWRHSGLGFLEKP